MKAKDISRADDLLTELKDIEHRKDKIRSVQVAFSSGLRFQEFDLFQIVGDGKIDLAEENAKREALLSAIKEALFDRRIRLIKNELKSMGVELDDEQ